jgi:DNA-binding winged helix-turn-helix (wHTH) protein/ATP/maltotriose-dependent transcriptional regulator MalT
VKNATPYRFGPCELDEARRSLSSHGREIRLQPRVFDLLCYLVRHRDRVVSKDELLDALWPGTIVVDNALQRAVSLARNALAEVGVSDAVRTYPRHGYRFCFDDSQPAAAAVPDATAAPEQGSPAGEGDAVAAAHAACERNDWVKACACFAWAEAQSALSAPDVEQWGRAAICAGMGLSAVAALERVVAERDSAGDTLAAARATLLLVQIRIDNKQGAAARGLLQRAARYLDGQRRSSERGHFAWMASRHALGSGDLQAALAMADEACELGRALHDPDVECLGLVYRGHALMARGDIAAGLEQQEEAAAVIQLGGVRSWVAGWALCSILYAARYRCDWLRAAQFAEMFFAWSRACSMPAFPGTCQLHRAAVLGVRGELDRAASEVRSAATLLADAAPWAEGDAYCVLGDIQSSTGDFEAAEASYRQAHSLGWNPQPGLARLHLLTGRPELAQRGLERALEESDFTLRERRGQLLCLLVHAAVGAGDIERARKALQAVNDEPAIVTSEALQAMHCAASAELAAATGDFRLAVQGLTRAVRHWREVGSPVGEAEARVRLAECLLQDGDVTGAEMEVHAVEAALSAASQPHRARVRALREALAAAHAGRRTA